MTVNYPKNIIVHHSAISYNKNPSQFDAINRYHKSKGWGMIGYHFLIEKDGTVKKGRAIGMQGAHCYQEGMNFKSIGICLTGNFDIELPTSEQQESLRGLMVDLMKTYQIPIEKIYPHRHFATYKSCYGRLLSDTWVQKLITNENMYKIVKEKSNPDLFLLVHGTKNLVKISNYPSYKEGLNSGLWGAEIEEFDSLADYNVISEVMLTKAD